MQVSAVQSANEWVSYPESFHTISIPHSPCVKPCPGAYVVGERLPWNAWRTRLEGQCCHLDFERPALCSLTDIASETIFVLRLAKYLGLPTSVEREVSWEGAVGMSRHDPSSHMQITSRRSRASLACKRRLTYVNSATWCTMRYLHPSSVSWTVVAWQSHDRLA